jgi:hypothetical protein
VFEVLNGLKDSNWRLTGDCVVHGVKVLNGLKDSNWHLKR